MSDWNQDIAPKMREVLTMLKRSRMNRAAKLDIKESVEDIFLKRPKTIGSLSPDNQRVIMQDEPIENFNLTEWIQLKKEFSDLKI